MVEQSSHFKAILINSKDLEKPSDILNNPRIHFIAISLEGAAFFEEIRNSPKKFALFRISILKEILFQNAKKYEIAKSRVALRTSYTDLAPDVVVANILILSCFIPF